LKLVLDTNTLVSAIGWTGPLARILTACRTGRFDLVTSPQLLEELIRVLTYPKLSILAQQADLPEILKWIHAPERLVYPRRTLHVISVDTPDNRVLEAAAQGKADGIVSGDEHLVSLKVFEGIPILTPAAFCRKWNV
jgi:putative PIN family toxin of toxin-antitoxin system